MGLLVISATRLLIISNYNATTATAVASSGGYVNTLLGSVIPLVPVTLPYLAVLLLGFRRILLASLTAVAALLVSPAHVTFPHLIDPNSGLAVKYDWHLVTIDHPNQTLWTAAILFSLTIMTAWKLDSDVKEEVIDDVISNDLSRPVSRWIKVPTLPLPANASDHDPQSFEENPEVARIARRHRVSNSAVVAWANNIGPWFRKGTLAFLALAYLISVLYVSYIYPFPRSARYYQTILRTPWLPAETLYLSSGRRFVGYPLSTDNGWFIFLSDTSRTIRYLPAGKIAARTVCNGGDQRELAASAPPVIRLLRSTSTKTPSCGYSSIIRLQVAKWVATPQRISSKSFRTVAHLGGIHICSTGVIEATMSVELRKAAAGFRIAVQGNDAMKPGRVRFIPTGLHGSSSFVFVYNPHGSTVPTVRVLNVEWRSPTGSTAKLERATVAVRFKGLAAKCSR